MHIRRDIGLCSRLRNMLIKDNGATVFERPAAKSYTARIGKLDAGARNGFACLEDCISRACEKTARERLSFLQAREWP